MELDLNLLWESGKPAAGVVKETQAGRLCDRVVFRVASPAMEWHSVLVHKGEALQVLQLAGCETAEALEAPGAAKLWKIQAGGKEAWVWMPGPPVRFAVDAQGRALEQAGGPFLPEWSGGDSLTCRLQPSPDKPGAFLLGYLVLWDPALLEALRESSRPAPLAWRKSEWFAASCPADFWKDFLHGHLFDPRVREPVRKRIRSQQYAFAWWQALELSAREKPSPLFRAWQRMLAASVLDDWKSGGWKHGFWSEDMETHARFYWDGVRLLLAEHRQGKQAEFLGAAEEAAENGVKIFGELWPSGLRWFLHDTGEDGRKHQFRSRVLGKSTANALCLNTHVQALCVLRDAGRQLPQPNHFQEYYTQGLRALRQVLELDGGSLAYRRLSLFLKADLVAERTRGLLLKLAGSWGKNRKRKLREAYWKLRQKHPRLVHPDGFIERDLTLSFYSDKYHVLNVKDLLELYLGDRQDWLRPYLDRGVAWIRRLDLEKALERSPYYWEWPDVLRLHERAGGAVGGGEIAEAEALLQRAGGGRSLDSALIEGKLWP
jgi:hypothetical protein